ncbi:hypothetical protein G9A89_010638 [Geosiphon pyriformis]|nr:hypothetical protein G9A89_010638 [Geosiphon pyriformis]
MNNTNEFRECMVMNLSRSNFVLANRGVSKDEVIGNTKKFLKENNENPEEFLEWLCDYPMISHKTHLVGFFYRYGIGTKIDLEKAFNAYKLAANEYNDTLSQIHLGNCYIYGRGTKPNPDQGFVWFSKAAKTGSARALYDLAFSYQDRGGVEAAFQCMLKSSLGGHAMAQISLGAFYSLGLGCSIDTRKAFYWFSQSAKNQKAEGKYALGKCFRYGIGTVRDTHMALKYLKSARQRKSQAIIAIEDIFSRR